MKKYNHWAFSLQSGDRVLATIRHKTDGSKNIHNADVIIVENKIDDEVVHAVFSGAYNELIYEIPYNELKETDYDFIERHLKIIKEKIKIAKQQSK